MNAKHTPTPWYATNGHIQSAVINHDNYVCEAEGNTPEQADANAALIVRAVNCHDELVAALELAFREACGDNKSQDLIDVLDSALTTAKQP